MPLNDALALWYERVHPQWLRRSWPVLVFSGLLLLAELVIGYANSGLLPAGAAQDGGPLALLVGLRRNQAALIAQWSAGALGVCLLAMALWQRRGLLVLPGDLRLALSSGDFRTYARTLVDGIEERVLLWALPLNGLLVYGGAWLLLFMNGGSGLGRIGLPLLAVLFFKTFLALLIMLMLLRNLDAFWLATFIGLSYLGWGFVSWLCGLFGPEGLLDLGLRLPTAYVSSVAEIGVLIVAIAILLPQLAYRRDVVQSAYGKRH